MIKSKFTRIAFDMSSLMWTNLRQGIDHEHGKKVMHEGKEVQVNSAVYGFDKCQERIVEALQTTGLTPIHMLMVFEGLNSKGQRVLQYPGYKAGTGKAADEYTEFQKLSDMLWARWKDLGAIKMKTDYCEGDDTLAFLAQNTESDLIIYTGDGDLAILAGTNAFGAEVSVLTRGMLNNNPIAPAPVKLLTLYKALVGDTSDKIKGVVGFGDKAWERMIAAFGYDGLEELDGLARTGQRGPLEAVASGDPDILKILDQWQAFTSSYQVALLHPEWVDTMNAPLQVTPGMVAKAQGEVELALRPWYATGRLVTKDNIDTLVPWILGEIVVSDWVSLDIETAPTEESEAWAETAGRGPDKVDVLGARTTGLSLTFGKNQQHSVYFSIDHYDTKNVSFAEVWAVVQQIKQECVIQNVNFELPVLYLGSGGNHIDKSEWGFIPNIRDTKLEANYVNENMRTGLKERSQHYLGYTQTTFDEVTTLTGKAGMMLPGGRLVREFADEEGMAMETRQYNMRELPAKHVVSYGLDDTRCTSSLHNFYRLMMELEHQWDVYLEVEIDAAYMTAASFLEGVPFSVSRMQQLVDKDGKAMRDAWDIIKVYLTEKGWAGTICPVLTGESSPKDIKEGLQICSRYELKTAVRTPSKLVALMQAITVEQLEKECLSQEKGDEEEESGLGFELKDCEQVWKDIQLFASLYAKALALDAEPLNVFLRKKFTGDPVLNFGSPKQKQTLLYETMALPVRVRNKPTKLMRAKGLEGSPKTDALAIAYAMMEAPERERDVLKSIKVYLSCQTKFNLYYNKYPSLLHWADGKLHPSVNQSQTNTRRASCASPNFQQMPKHPKVEGEKVEFRECIIPHKKNAVVVSFDFKAQELVIIADYSQDPNMLACFIGEHKKDMHSLTGQAILKVTKNINWSYEEFTAHLHDKESPHFKTAKQARVDGKKVNFTTEYGAMAEKLATTMLVDEDTAQLYIDAKEAQFPVVGQWKDNVIAEAKEKGYVLTRMGARRHLREALTSDDRWEASKAERQAVNFKIQSSSAEQTKRAMGKAWRQGVIFKFDCCFYGPIHDETVWSCDVSQLAAFIPVVHNCMVAPYGGLTVPILSSVSFGPNFGTQIEINEDGEPPTLTAINKGILELESV